MRDKRVSILLPVFNCGSSLACALDSLLAQTFRNFEVIAIDDGSTDQSLAVLQEYAARDPRVKVLHQENRGLAAALNLAASSAGGEFLARQDGDDVSAPERLERQVRLMIDSPDMVLSGCWSCFVHPELGPQAVCEVPNDDLKLKRMLYGGSNPFFHGSVMMRRSAFEACAGGYRFRMAQDYDLWLRMASLGRFGMVESVGYYYTMSELSISSIRFKARAALVRRIRRANTEPDRVREQKSAIGAVPGELGFYQVGIFRLLGGDKDGFIEAMRRVVSKGGCLTRRARLLILLAPCAWLARRWYLWRMRTTAMRYLRVFPRGPSWTHGTEGLLADRGRSGPPPTS